MKVRRFESCVTHQSRNFQADILNLKSIIIKSYLSEPYFQINPTHFLQLQAVHSQKCGALLLHVDKSFLLSLASTFTPPP